MYINLIVYVLCCVVESELDWSSVNSYATDLALIISHKLNH